MAVTKMYGLTRYDIEMDIEDGFDPWYTSYPSEQGDWVKYEDAAAEIERLRKQPCNCWEKVNALIKRGELQGNGCDETAQRNGIILAANAISPAFEVEFKP